MSRGFHAFFRQYYNLRALLRRADPTLERLRPVDDYPLVSADGLVESFAKIPRTPPFSFASFVLLSPSFSASSLARVDVAAALELLNVRFPDTFAAYDGESAAAFLDRLRFPPEARHLALEVFARSFFTHPSEFSAGELVAMFHTYFLGSAEGLLFDVPTDDYDTALWGPLGRYLHALGVEVYTHRAVEHVSCGEHGVAVRLADGQILRADACVLAADPASTRLLATTCDFSGDYAPQSHTLWLASLSATRNAPSFAVWRLWLDRPVRADRKAFLGTSGFGLLDNVSVLEQFEDGAAAWHRRTGGSVVELHAYALPDGIGDDDARQRTKAELRAELARVYPETGAARVVAEEWLVRDDCPLIGTGPWRARPGIETPDPRLVLAGDGIRCDFPVALMERAATTGFQAANALLARWGTAGHDLWTVPMTGRQPLGRVVAALTL
jgi:isorenieratene synthase